MSIQNGELKKKTFFLFLQQYVVNGHHYTSDDHVLRLWIVGTLTCVVVIVTPFLR